MGRIGIWAKSNWKILAFGAVLAGAGFLVFEGRVSAALVMVGVGLLAGVLGLSKQLDGHKAELAGLLAALGLAGVEYRKGDKEGALKIAGGALGSVALTELTAHGVPKVSANDIPLLAGGFLTVHAGSGVEMAEHLQVLTDGAAIRKTTGS